MSDLETKQIIERIKNARAVKGYSYQELSKLTGLSKSTLQRYETGDIQNIPLNKVKVLANALGVSPEYLMGWEEQKETPAISEDISKEARKTAILYDKASEDDKSIVDLTLKKYEKVKKPEEKVM